MTEELNLKLHLILITLNIGSYMSPVALALDSVEYSAYVRISEILQILSVVLKPRLPSSFLTPKCILSSIRVISSCKFTL